jgi:hypothetical protein
MNTTQIHCEGIPLTISYLVETSEKSARSFEITVTSITHADQEIIGLISDDFAEAIYRQLLTEVAAERNLR